MFYFSFIFFKNCRARLNNDVEFVGENFTCNHWRSKTEVRVTVLKIQRYLEVVNRVVKQIFHFCFCHYCFPHCSCGYCCYCSNEMAFLIWNKNLKYFCNYVLLWFGLLNSFLNWTFSFNRSKKSWTFHWRFIFLF